MLTARDLSDLGYKHKNSIFWLGILNSLVSPINVNDLVLDVGCGSGLFLKTLYHFFPYSSGYGIDTSKDAIEAARVNTVGDPIFYINTSLKDFCLNYKQKSFSHVFCQEVLWMNHDLYQFANALFALMSDKGVCYCTVGCHEENPIWQYRRLQMTKEGIQNFSHHIDNIADIFASVGFAVGLRRLPIDGFLMYHPIDTKKRSKSFFDLVQSTYQHKMLFYFGKGVNVGKTINIYD